MILKNQSTQLELQLQNTQSSVGLREGDRWCLVTLKVKNKTIEYSMEKEAISKSELEDLLVQLNDFIHSNFTQKRRISFIKNYFIIYLYNKARGKKVMKLKIIHVNNSEQSYLLEFDQFEILEFINLLKQEKI